MNKLKEKNSISIKKKYEPGLSLIMATIGRTNELNNFFESINNLPDIPLEVIVIDQNYDNRLNNIIAAAQENGFQVNHIKTNSVGLSAARNIGLLKAKYEIIGFPDDDCWYESNCCELVYAAFAADKELDGLVARWADRHKDDFNPRTLSFGEQRRFMGTPIASICIFLRTSCITSIDGFDNNFGIGAWFGSSEETDLILRLLSSGHRIEYKPNIIVRHIWTGAAIDVTCNINEIYRRTQARARGTGAIYAKHRVPAWTAIKGIIAPAIRSIISSKGKRGFLYYSALLIGRIEGYIKWKIKH